MPDLIESLLPELKRHRIPGLDLGDDSQSPHYDGLSILNVPSGVSQLLGAPPLGAPPLDSRVTAPLGDGVRRVILILMDALALHRLQSWLESERLAAWKNLLQDGVLAPITSITPSTTCAAITTYWSGRSAAEHGITGYEMWMKEYGVIANMILHAPMYLHSEAGALKTAGFDAENYLAFPTMGTHLAAHGVSTYAFQHYSIMNSGLSEMFFRDVNKRSFSTAADLWISMRQLLEKSPEEKMYCWAYWSNVDSLSHRHGPDDPRPQAEFENFTQAFQDYFLNALSAAAREDTVVILTADHGQLTTRLDPHYELNTHPDLDRRLHLKPTGENRLFYLHVRPGQTEAVREYIEKHWMGQFQVVDAAYALDVGLFGPGQPHPGMQDRLGDLIVVPHGDSYLWWADKPNPLVGRHGGLHPEEMLVPFLAGRL
ncbi:MAG: alkaline phosphatase family protein [Anaerolineales bacterium]|nr:alkaline phosphatase family protein [Anaerolineales bacterium]